MLPGVSELHKVLKVNFTDFPHQSVFPSVGKLGLHMCKKLMMVSLESVLAGAGDYKFVK